ncbi:MAG: TonB-dependent receptor [Candidatus Thiodiazotropha sp. (ex Epidulcina cf. delphinae)]|nr:TonB-dependent receptor [Candidatus Thiodiazotropha sp. (ex Epidulcina cf. delphinae)]
MFSRSLRTADATERYLASFSRNMMTGMDASWVGNPELEPERHYQFEIGYQWQGAGWNSDVTAYYGAGLIQRCLGLYPARQCGSQLRHRQRLR